MVTLPSKINILAELERLGVRYEFSGTENVKCLCPFHEDKTPSCAINTENGMFQCFVCKKGGDFLAFVSRLVDRPRALVFADLLQRYDISDEPTVDPVLIESWHQKIWSAHALLKELYNRGVTDDLIRKYRLGENAGRVTIPIAVQNGAVVNVRRYLPGAPGPDKMRNLKGRGKPKLFPIDQLRFSQIALCGGEMKAIVAAKQLNEIGIGAVSTTLGEDNWDRSFNDLLQNKSKIWVIDDIDETGERSSEMKARILFPLVPWVGIVKLPLDKEKYPKGDINDFIATEKGDLTQVVLNTEQWAPALKERFDPNELATRVSLTEAYSSDNTTKRLQVEATVAAIAENTYVIPSRVKAVCDKAQDCCGKCLVFLSNKEEYDIHPEDSVVLDIVEEHTGNQREALMRSIGVPRECQTVTFETTQYHQADDVRISPKLEILNRASERTLLRVICMSGGLQLNENYVFTGRQYPHPRDQSATFIASKFEATGDALANFSVEDFKQLDKFRPKEWTVESLTEKLDDIYADLEYNVTYIRQRRNLHLAMDLVWHSPLFISFDERIEKGNVEALVVGDSAQGKSETAKRLLEHYGVGVKVECKNATVAGLLGGLQKLGGRWFVSWGIIPTHDKRMVILEELKGASVEVISKLTEMRSSGVAEIPKIEKRRTTARTRLVALSNPRSDRPMSSYSFGIEAIKELIGSLEDVRRFDMCIIVSRDEVDASVINMPRSEWTKVDHKYDAESCRNLILWSWTRSEHAVTFEREAQEKVLQYSSKLNELYSNEIPVVDTASMRYKLARLSAALAGRTFSASEDCSRLIVRPCHVEYVFNYLVSVYSSHAFGYVDYTKAVRDSKDIADPHIVEKTIRNAPHPRDFAESLLRATRFDQQDVQDWCGIDRLEASTIISSLVRKRAISRDAGQSYTKTPGLIEILKKLVEEKLPEMPPHLKECEF